MNRIRILALIILAALSAQAVFAAVTPSGLDGLRRFFNQVRSYTAGFNQVVLDEALNVIQESSGTLWIQRPNKFRWNYDAPYKQQIIADGSRIWVYDEELRQVTVRPLSGGLGDTPAMLLAGQGKLDDNFSVGKLGSQGTLDWVQLNPRRRDGGFETIRVGFEKGRIRSLEMIDGFGQTTRVTLNDGKENTKIDTDQFSFTPPEGVDVVGQ
jgi:outer membrane lipoprotein carrier protein